MIYKFATFSVGTQNTLHGQYSRQRGISLLLALTLVVIITSIVTGVALNTHYAIRRSGVITHLAQADAYAAGALDYAQRVLQLDSYTGTIDTLAEEWAQRLPPYPVAGGTVSGYISEVGSRFNLAGIAIKDPFEIKVFKRLWKSLDGTQSQAERIIAAASTQQYADLIGVLTAADIDENTIHRLSSRLTYLPINAEKLNINIVSPTVLAAYLDISLERANDILREREQQPIETLTALNIFANRHGIGQISTDKQRQNAPSVIALRFDVKSRYFQAIGQAQIGDTHAVVVALLDRRGNTIKRLNQRLSKLADE